MVVFSTILVVSGAEGGDSAVSVMVREGGRDEGAAAARGAD